MTRIYNQQFVAHVFAAASGSRAAASYHALAEIWRGCESLFEMTAPITGTALPAQFPGTETLREAAAVGGEVALAATERPGATSQAVLRLHHDVLNLSVGLAPPQASSASPGGDWPWWRDLDYQWSLLLARYAGDLLGEARLFITQVDAEAAIRAADPALYAELAPLLPASDANHRGAGTSVGVPLPGGFAIWEADAGPDDRAARRLMIPVGADADPPASAWAWSGSDTAIPPLARYLLHAAKIRYELRVWKRDSQARQLGESLDALGGTLRVNVDDLATRELLRLRRMDAVMLHADLLALRQTVTIAEDNLGRGLDLCALAIPGGMFADDVALARWLRERLDDEAGYLSIASDRAGQLLDMLPPAPEPTRAGPITTSPAAAPVAEVEVEADHDPRRNVFVVYGRDDPARRAVFEFLRSLGLRPLEWESLVEATGKMAPFLSETVRKGLEMAAAAVVLLTPEDVVHLHPDLHGPNEPAAETAGAMQARPNVLLELGMALALKPKGTLVLVIGEQRPVTDLGGMSYVRLTTDPDCRSRIADRLKVAGCLVNQIGTDWLKTGDFAGLAAQYRKPGTL